MDVNKAIEDLIGNTGDNDDVWGGNNNYREDSLAIVYRYIHTTADAPALRDLSQRERTLLLDVLMECMEEKAEMVYPSTQEDADVQENWIPPLTLCCGIAASIYTELLGLESGALVWVQLQAISSLGNVFHRWKVMMMNTENNNMQNDDDDDWGMRVARAVLKIPLQRDFGTSWPLEAVESILQIAISTLSTASALKQNEFRLDLHNCFPSFESEQETTAIEDDGDESIGNVGGMLSSFVPRKLQIMRYILRGLYPVLLRREEVPNGEVGKTAAAKAATIVLKDLILHPCAAADHPTSPFTNNHLDSSPATTTPKPKRARASRTPRSTANRRQLLTPKTKKTPRSMLKTPSTAATDTPSLVSTLVGMLQKLTTAHDLQKTNVRASVTDTIVNALQLLVPWEQKTRFLSFLRRLAQSSVPVHRLVAVDLMGKLMTNEWSINANSTTADLVEEEKTKLWLALQERLTDLAATVRTATCAAIGLMAKKLQQVASLSFADDDTDQLTLFLRQRALLDEKASVRRAACNALIETIVSTGESANADDTAVLVELCRSDTSVLLRGSAAVGLTRMVEQWPADTALATAWADSVLPLMHDSACADKVKELMDRVILQPILDKDRHQQALAWKILASIQTGDGHSQSQMDALYAMLQVSTNTKLFRVLRQNAIQSVDSDDEEHQAGVWRLFRAAAGQEKDRSAISKVAKRANVDFAFLGTCLNGLLQDSNGSTAMDERIENCLGVWSQLATCVHDDVLESVASTLFLHLKELKLSTDLIGSAITALTAITLAQTSDSCSCSTWIKDLYGHMESALSEMIGQTIGDKESMLLSCAIITAGELCLVGFSPTEEQGLPESAGAPGPSDSSILACGLHERPNTRIVDFILSFMMKELPGLNGIAVPVTVRAHAFLAAGKICLRDSNLAKKILNILAQELQNDGQWKVKNSALFILGDLCIRYTSMADKFLPNMAACLQAGKRESGTSWAPNNSSIVRKHAILILSGLLLQDYIKMKGLLLYRFLVATIDSDESVASLAESVLTGPLFAKNQKIFSDHFVEALFVLNRCSAHSMYHTAVAAEIGEDGGVSSTGADNSFEGVELLGEEGRSPRMKVYEMMLSKMTDEEKIGVTARLGKEIFGSALEVGSDLHAICTAPCPGQQRPSFESAYNVLRDAFCVLGNPAIRVGKIALSSEEDEIEDPNISTDNKKTKKVQVAKGRLLSNMSRQHFIGTLLPLLINLKALLSENRSPLLGELMKCLLDVFKRFKEEAKTVLANDPTTLAELEFDARKQQKRDSKSKRRSSLEDAPPTPRQRHTPTADGGGVVVDQNVPHQFTPPKEVTLKHQEMKDK